MPEVEQLGCVEYKRLVDSEVSAHADAEVFDHEPVLFRGVVDCHLPATVSGFTLRYSLLRRL